MQETRVLVETRGTTGEETISYWFDLPIDVAEFEEKLGIGAESQDYRIIEKVLPFADEIHEHTSVYQLCLLYTSGNTDIVEVTADTVYIKELSAPAGYKVDKTVYSLKVEAGKTILFLLVHIL